jgi:RNA-directed DNA polymerase
MDRVYAFCRRKKLGNLDLRKGQTRAQFLDSSDAEIIVAYNSELRGFAHYYAIADGVRSSLSKLELVMFRSLLATMASRHRTTVKRTMIRLRMGTDYGVTTMIRGELRIHRLWRLKHLTVTTWQHAAVDNITVGSRLAQSPNDLISRLSASECEACGNEDGPFEVHHPNRLKDKRHGPMTPWKQSARRRRTVVLCRSCHVAFHGGRMPDGMESRVH